MLCYEQGQRSLPATIPMDNYNEREKTALRSFRARISDLGLDWFNGHNGNIIRWLRARDLNVDKAELMLRKAIEWRKLHKIDTLLQREVPEYMIKNFPFQVCGLDDDGDIVAVVPYGKWDFRELVERGEKHELLNYINYIFALAEKFLKQKSSQETVYNQIVLILDIEGFSMKQIMHKPTIEFLLQVMKTLEDNFPEVLKRGILINAPKIFELLWAIAKPLLTGRTLSKVEIYGGNPNSYKPRLLECVPSHVLPANYGGGNTTSKNHLYYYNQVLNSLSQGNNETLDMEILISNSLPENDVTEVIVGAGSRFETSVEVPSAGSILKWDFKTLDNDIGFSVANSTEGIIAQFKRTDAHKVNQVGTHKCASSGTYTFTFDNTYSRFFTKRLLFAITVEDA